MHFHIYLLYIHLCSIYVTDLHLFSLISSRRIHNGDRPFPCSKCDITFVCISNLRRHRRQAHPGPPVAIAPPPLPSTVEGDKYADNPSSTTGVTFMSPGSIMLTSSASSGASPMRNDLLTVGGGGSFQQTTSSSPGTTSTVAINEMRLVPICSTNGNYYCPTVFFHFYSACLAVHVF